MPYVQSNFMCNPGQTIFVLKGVAFRQLANTVGFLLKRV